MSPNPQTIETLDALLTEACRIADLHGLGLTAIRIEEALIAMHDSDTAPPLRWDPWTTVSTLN